MSRLSFLASCFLGGLVSASMTVAFSPAIMDAPPSRTRNQGSVIQLDAIPSSSSNGFGSTARGVPSRTAMESAVNVEWEPMTELERRLEDGVNYEHFVDRPPRWSSHQHVSRISDSGDSADEIPRTRGVFCGYKATEEEYNRLKSANPLD
jgi:hypothetical protein